MAKTAVIIGICQSIAQTVTAALSRLLLSDGSVSWSSIRAEFQNENKVKRSRIGQLMTMLPTNESGADPTVNGVAVWRTKTGLKRSWMIHKKTDLSRARKSVAGMLNIQHPDPIVH